MLIPSGITVDVIRPVSTMPVIVLNPFIFLVICSRTSISLIKYASLSLSLFNRYVCGYCGAVGFKPGQVFVSLSYKLILYLIVGGRMFSG